MPYKNYTDYAYYVGDEIKYGCYLYYSGWKKLLLHPWQTAKDIAYAAYHPIDTGKILITQVKQHPIAMATNLSLSWATGYVISASIEYIVPEVEVSSQLSPVLQAQNSTSTTKSSISSTLSQTVQVSSQIASGRCCGGICTFGRIGQTTSVVTSQSASSAENRQKSSSTENSTVAKKPSSFLSYFWQTRPKEKVCQDSSCTTAVHRSEEPQKVFNVQQFPL